MDTITIKLIVDLAGKAKDVTVVPVHFVRLGNQTGAIIELSRGVGVPYASGVAFRNPKDDENQLYGMKVAIRRACVQFDGQHVWNRKTDRYDGALGPVGKEIYAAYRYYTRNWIELDWNDGAYKIGGSNENNP